MLSSSAFNPFANWSHVYVPYSSGDLYLGRGHKLRSVREKIDLHFAGHRTLEAIVSDLKNTTAFGQATRVLFTGGSAGGIGTMHNSDWLASRLPKGADYKAAPQAGAFFNNEQILMMPEYTSGIRNETGANAADPMSLYVVNWFGGRSDAPPFLDESCVAAVTPNHTCFNAAVHYPYISTPTFLAQNRFDQCTAGDCMLADFWPEPFEHHAEAKAGYLRYFGRQTISGIAAQGVSKPNDALWMPSCYEHTGNLCMRNDSTRVNGVSFAEALDAWFAGRDGPHRRIDDCNADTDDPCNTNCAC